MYIKCNLNISGSTCYLQILFLNQKYELVCRISAIVTPRLFNWTSCSLFRTFLTISNISLLTLYSLVLSRFHFAHFVTSNKHSKTRMHVSDHTEDATYQERSTLPSSAASFQLPSSTTCSRKITFKVLRCGMVSRPRHLHIMLAVSWSLLQDFVWTIHVPDVLIITQDKN